MYLMIFKCYTLFKIKAVWFKEEYQKDKSWLWWKEELGMEEGNLLLSKW